MSSNIRPFRLIYRWPLVLGIITAGGLLFALLGDNLWDVASWLLLAIPVLTISVLLMRRSRNA